MMMAHHIMKLLHVKLRHGRFFHTLEYDETLDNSLHLRFWDDRFFQDGTGAIRQLAD